MPLRIPVASGGPGTAGYRSTQAAASWVSRPLRQQRDAGGRRPFLASLAAQRDSTHETHLFDHPLTTDRPGAQS